MPTYVYECTKGHNFEAIQRITENAFTKCTKLVGEPGKVDICGAPCKRVIQPANFSLKGGGWYKDGYSSTPAKKVGGETKKSTPDQK